MKRYVTSQLWAKSLRWKEPFLQGVLVKVVPYRTLVLCVHSEMNTSFSLASLQATPFLISRLVWQSVWKKYKKSHFVILTSVRVSFPFSDTVTVVGLLINISYSCSQYQMNSIFAQCVFAPTVSGYGIAKENQLEVQKSVVLWMEAPIVRRDLKKGIRLFNHW